MKKRNKKKCTKKIYIIIAIAIGVLIMTYGCVVNYEQTTSVRIHPSRQSYKLPPSIKVIKKNGKVYFQRDTVRLKIIKRD